MSDNEWVAGNADRTGDSLPREPWRRLDGVILKATAAALAHVATGRLRLTMPSGVSASIGNGAPAEEVDLALANYAVFWKSLRRGSVGFAESILDGDCESRDLNQLFRYFLRNKAALDEAGRGLFRVRLPLRLYHLRRANTRHGSRRNIAAHYDLGNDFYRLWLDPGMTYSSGIFSHEKMSLQSAQHAKYQRILEALEPRAGQTVLEIGCGWGGFLEAAARTGLAATGITISREQLEFAQARLSRLNVETPPKVRFEDYRDTRGQFDRIASIEMIEAVGEENWPTFFATLSGRLAPGGIAAVQAITIREDWFETYRRKADFIQRYIFPGGMLPTVNGMARAARANGLTFEPVTTFADSYARTLALWRQRFHDAWPQIAALGFDDRFRRMWDYYLAYCEVGFAERSIDVGIYRMRKRR